jgi:lipoprotein NlpD
MHLKINSSQLSGRSVMLFIAALVIALLAGCAQKRGPAPVEKRPVAKAPTPSQRSITGAPLAAVPEGFYSVKRGDTLIGIALDHGVSWRDVVAWNQLDNPNLIEVDQLLRVKPLPGERATAVAAAPAAGTRQDPRSEARAAGGIEVRPIAAAPAGASATASTNTSANSAASAGAAPKAAPGSPSATPSATPPTVIASAPLSVPAPAASQGAAAPAAGAVASVEGVNWGWPGSGRVINQFADPGYKGIALSGAEGDPVVAASDGRVVYSGSGLRGYGNLVIVKHDADFLTAYAHNKTILVSEGQTVKRGQKIAELGKTDSDVPKLHFEVRKSGKPVDPMKFLPAR